MCCIKTLIGKNTGKKAKKKPFYLGRFEPAFGPNTKQWWLYDRETNEMCDPPIEVLNKVREINFDKQEEELQKIVNQNPNWLYNNGHRYDGDLEI